MAAEDRVDEEPDEDEWPEGSNGLGEEPLYSREVAKP